MKFESLVNHMPPHGVFRRGQILAGQLNPANVERQLDRWTKSGRLLQLRRGVYALGKPYTRISPHPFLTANLLKRASYVSLQSALSYYGMIPEYVPATTSVTTGRPETLATPLGRFQYRHVARQLFDGFNEIEIAADQRVLIAAPEKALVDILYLTPHSDSEDFLRELRVLPHPSFADETVLLSAARASLSKKVLRAMSCLVKILQEDAM